MKNHLIIYFLIFPFFPMVVNAQYIPLDNRYYDLLYEHYEAKNQSFLSAMKPLLIQEIDSAVNIQDVLYGKGTAKHRNSFFYRKLFTESLIRYNSGIVKISADPVFHFGLGRETDNGRTSWVNTRGITINGLLGNIFSFNTELYENQAVYASWTDSLIRALQVIPGQGTYKFFGEKGYDFAYSNGYLSCHPSKYFSVSLGYGKNFIGDGYRSMILSDVAFSYPYLKLTGNLKRIKYTVLYTQLVGRNAIQRPEFGYERKWATMHYLQVLLWKRLNVGLFDAVVWENADTSGYRGFDVQYLNPVVLLRPLEFSIGSPDNALMGMTFNLRVNSHFNLYGQMLLDEFKLSHIIKNDGWWGNKFGYQIGISGWNLADIPSLNARVEYNQARPYTYSHSVPIQSYSHFNQSLAHPLGANFRELIVITSFSRGNWLANIKMNFAMYGADTAGKDFGRNILIPYTQHVSELNNSIGQGLKTNLNTTDACFSYMLNRRTNLRIEAGIIVRNENNDQFSKQAVLFYGGIRTGLRNLYNDF